jgi:hypothetical protein
MYVDQAVRIWFYRHFCSTGRGTLGSPARYTFFRKLAQLEYLSSYSHRCKYYTHRTIARFYVLGLWCHRAVWFSRYGNLLDTVCALTGV